ncbi:L-fucose:H+ symporter permease [Mangrovibacterium lignilyticum]|uniref:L-fucose:H+ symporter permease n=1 Tax=Mangrovibacterium lignilyticum TaxID=2668052 RepID=UPI0013D20F7D|nr:L-fucose:H+ symporter permease [Mangrovibacterium lignilyticum]
MTTFSLSAKSAAPSKSKANSYILPLILIVSLFFMWGMGSSINDILIKQFKKTFELTDFESGLVQSAFYLGYFLFAIPASLVMKKFNYKTGIVTGLFLFAAGAFLFYPAAQLESYAFFLFALFIIASGLTFLETAGNPYVAALGDPATATFRLNLAQAFNPIGCVTGILIGQHFILTGVEHSKEELASMSHAAVQAYYTAEAHTVQMPYLIIGLTIVVAALVIFLTKFPVVRDEETQSSVSTRQTLKFILSKRHYRMAVIAQFFYIGAQVCIWSYLIRYIQETIPGTSEKDAANFLTISLVVFTAGRFIGTALLKRIKGHNLLWLYAALNVTLIAVALAFPGTIGLWALVATSFFMSIMYPTIFSLGIRGLGEHTKLASSVLVMAIIGGALLTPVMGLVSVYFGIGNAIVIPLICFAFIAYYGMVGYKEKTEEEVLA